MERKTCCMTESCRPAVNMERFPVAMAYVPWQHYHTTYDLCQAFAQGTIFPELDRPFCGKRRCR